MQLPETVDSEEPICICLVRGKKPDEFAVVNHNHDHTIDGLLVLMQQATQLHPRQVEREKSAA